MMYSIFRRGRICLIALGLVGLTLCENLAQQRTGTRTGSARTAGAGGSRTGGGVYPSNSEIGEAMISSDPETRSIIVISDEQTNEQIKRVIQNLDRPKPQVLIKVLFLEVNHDKSLDVGVEGNYSKGMGNSTTGNVANVFGLAAAGAEAAEEAEAKPKPAPRLRATVVSADAVPTVPAVWPGGLPLRWPPHEPRVA